MDKATGQPAVSPMPAESGLRQSPCIDTGDPAMKASARMEPSGGGIVNLGFWGGTPFASRSALGTTFILLR